MGPWEDGRQLCGGCKLELTLAKPHVRAKLEEGIKAALSAAAGDLELPADTQGQPAKVTFPLRFELEGDDSTLRLSPETMERVRQVLAKIRRALELDALSTTSPPEGPESSP